MKEEMCIDCGKRPIHVKKRKLCEPCYQKLQHHNKGKSLLPKDEQQLCEVTQTKRQQNREVTFIKNFFRHSNWVYQPASFQLNGTIYRPDFYDANRGVFIEVAGSRQAYHINKHKYELFRKMFLGLILEIRRPSGELLETDKVRIKWD